MKNLRTLATVILLVVACLVGFQLYQVNAEVVRLKNENQQLIEAIKTLEKQTDILAQHVVTINKNVNKFNETIIEKTEMVNNISKVSRGGRRGTGIEFEATAYALGGHTALGVPLSGCSREDVMVIAADPDILPLGSYVYIEFDGDWSHYNGSYCVSDVGGAVNGYIIDVFVGHGNEDEAMSFGRRDVTVYLE